MSGLFLSHMHLTTGKYIKVYHATWAEYVLVIIARHKSYPCQRIHCFIMEQTDKSSSQLGITFWQRRVLMKYFWVNDKLKLYYLEIFLIDHVRSADLANSIPNSGLKILSRRKRLLSQIATQITKYTYYMNRIFLIDNRQIFYVPNPTLHNITLWSYTYRTRNCTECKQVSIKGSLTTCGLKYLFCETGIFLNTICQASSEDPAIPEIPRSQKDEHTEGYLIIASPGIVLFSIIVNTKQLDRYLTYFPMYKAPEISHIINWFVWLLASKCDSSHLLMDVHKTPWRKADLWKKIHWVLSRLLWWPEWIPLPVVCLVFSGGN